MTEEDIQFLKWAYMHYNALDLMMSRERGADPGTEEQWSARAYNKHKLWCVGQGTSMTDAIKDLISRIDHTEKNT